MVKKYILGLILLNFLSSISFATTDVYPPWGYNRFTPPFVTYDNYATTTAANTTKLLFYRAGYGSVFWINILLEVSSNEILENVNLEIWLDETLCIDLPIHNILAYNPLLARNAIFRTVWADEDTITKYICFCSDILWPFNKCIEIFLVNYSTEDVYTRYVICAYLSKS
jgi:hypothetical protein